MGQTSAPRGSTAAEEVSFIDSLATVPRRGMVRLLDASHTERASVQLRTETLGLDVEHFASALTTAASFRGSMARGSMARDSMARGSMARGSMARGSTNKEKAVQSQRADAEGGRASVQKRVNTNLARVRGDTAHPAARIPSPPEAAAPVSKGHGPLQHLEAESSLPSRLLEAYVSPSAEQVEAAPAGFKGSTQLWKALAKANAEAAIQARKAGAHAGADSQPTTEPSMRMPIEDIMENDAAKSALEAVLEDDSLAEDFLSPLQALAVKQDVERNRKRLARNRWQLYWMLYKNPLLQGYRGHVLEQMVEQRIEDAANAKAAAEPRLLSAAGLRGVAGKVVHAVEETAMLDELSKARRVLKKAPPRLTPPLLPVATPAPPSMPGANLSSASTLKPRTFATRSCSTLGHEDSMQLGV